VGVRLQQCLLGEIFQRTPVSESAGQQCEDRVLVARHEFGIRRGVAIQCFADKFSVSGLSDLIVDFSCSLHNSPVLPL